MTEATIVSISSEDICDICGLEKSGPDSTIVCDGCPAWTRPGGGEGGGRELRGGGGECRNRREDDDKESVEDRQEDYDDKQADVRHLKKIISEAQMDAEASFEDPFEVSECQNDELRFSEQKTEKKGEGEKREREV